MYQIKYDEKALKTLKKLDNNITQMIVAWMKKNLDCCDNPRKFGKGLSGNKSGQWRYRVGDCRIITDIKEETITILVLEIGHRRDIYK